MTQDIEKNVQQQNGVNSAIVQSSENVFNPVSEKMELWQMTKAEYEAEYGKLRRNTTVTGYYSPHRNAVEIAVNKGLPVPERVLKDYPTLR